MRIITGRWRGRTLFGPPSRRVRPLGDKVRGALFDVLGNIGGKSVLDAYAGTGAVGFEALSRGAKFVEAIEYSKPAARIIQSNARRLGAGEEFQLVVTKIGRWLDWPKSSKRQYDLIMADPPYGSFDPEMLARMGEYLNHSGTMAVSHSAKLTSPKLKGLELIQTKRYGDSALSFYKKVK